MFNITRGFSSLLVLVIIAALIVIGYVTYSVKTNQENIAKVETFQENITKVKTFSPISFLNGGVNSGVTFEGYENKELGITLELPKDWLTFRHNEGNYDYPETTLLILHEDSSDPTQVTIKRYPLSLSETLKTTERVSPSYYPDKWNVASTTLEEGQLDGMDVVRRVQYQKNECAAIDYLYSLSEEETGLVEISGVCASHTVGYDALKVKVAESVRFIGI